jgi:hypothetical protein
MGRVRHVLVGLWIAEYGLAVLGIRAYRTFMKTTLVLPQELVAALRERARAQGCSMSSIAEQALSAHLLALEDSSIPDLKLPSFEVGELLVDIADREALEEAMERQ